MVTSIDIQPIKKKLSMCQTLSMRKVNESVDKSEPIKKHNDVKKQHGGEWTGTDSMLIGKLTSARKRYSSSFTMHALSHIIEGSVLEKIFWATKLLGAIAVAIYLSWNLFVAYHRHDVHTEFKTVLKRSMRHPAVYICQKDYTHYFKLYNNCSSNKSKTYDTDLCTALNQRCPAFFLNSAYYKKMIKSKSYTAGLVSCEQELLGQCIVVNAYGKFAQTNRNSKMVYSQVINTSMLPLDVFIHSPGMGELVSYPFYQMIIHRLGEYKIALTKTTMNRLPYPYSKPPCIKEGSPAARSSNMFIGSYTISKCRKTCTTRIKLRCGMIRNIYRVLTRDQVSLKKLVKDENMSQLEKCYKTYKHTTSYDVALDKCYAKCFQPCVEETYSGQGYYSAPRGEQIYLKFYFREMAETKITESPKLEALTLFANFGGTLGLMMGMSVISMIELVIWLTLFVLERIHLVFKKLTARSIAHDWVA